MKARLRITTTFLLLMMSAFVLFGCASTPTQESTGEYLDSSLITTKVKTRLFEDPITKGFDISVKTFKGEVQLSGFVSSHKEKARAGEIAAGVKGVKSVKNDLVIKTP